ncbi:hypothetical protein A2634_05300 [Candidatus Amesbacteria bacterium RIFCSPHIGHO2_01_FULL_48_32]|uniref:Uncharacterized protein n=1 Tax=Candidatus Amesbacteria bacterium RIFCSPLOWO2_01_FULL_48_25 TaxID=1797259 RepID=A0A1F4ZCP9_9BACT|nr:MAG: hypothetical protein A2634_05300 [Candidatus Amesbacteria bacterium RIFCSPHIGHO2_01_FULL_48_32]OGD04083.1 MAG: hypothetical protein A2989_01645 [Candidatus Amesbacteria bacterium RIFCSPLOWO2_01_FULL_48_25]HJZ05651.1 hypothetical protein [Patescibacteria group bacterium]
MDQEIQSQESHSIKLPTFLTTVTPLSKTLAMALFIILPFAGFYLGIQYEKLVSTGSIKSSITPPPLIVSKYYQISPTIYPSSSNDSPTATPSKDECHENDKFFVIVDNQTGNFLIRYKSTINQKFNCIYSKNLEDYEILNEGADWYQELYNNFLFIDSGTGPPLREIAIYDLYKRQMIFSDGYNVPINIENGQFDYWKGVDTQVTKENCPDKDSWESGGLGTAIEEHVRFDLNSLKKSSLNETRCSPRQ